MNTATAVAIIAAIPTLAAAVIAGVNARSALNHSRETQRRQEAAEAEAKREAKERQEALDRAKLQSEAFERARETYKTLIDDLGQQLVRYQNSSGRVQSQLDRVTAQLDGVLERLVAEQDANVELRTQVATLERQLAVLQRQNVELQGENQRLADTLQRHREVTVQIDEQVRAAGSATAGQAAVPSRAPP